MHGSWLHSALAHCTSNFRHFKPRLRRLITTILDGLLCWCQLLHRITFSSVRLLCVCTLACNRHASGRHFVLCCVTPYTIFITVVVRQNLIGQPRADISHSGHYLQMSHSTSDDTGRTSNVHATAFRLTAHYTELKVAIKVAYLLCGRTKLAAGDKVRFMSANNFLCSSCSDNCKTNECQRRKFDKVYISCLFFAIINTYLIRVIMS